MMRISFYLLVTCSIFCSSLYAQNARSNTEREVEGKLVDSLGLFISGATIKLTSPQDTLLTSSDHQGAFAFKRVVSSNFELAIYGLGYSPLSRVYRLKDKSKTIQLDNIILKEAPIELNEVPIEGGPTISMYGDTLEYRTRHIQLREHALLEELMDKLPGIRLDMNGNLSVNGKPIDKVRINGIDFFGGNVALALSNLPAELINKLQIIDDYGEDAALTGIKKGEANKVLNLVVDEDKNKGFFANGVIGGGTSETFQLEAGVNSFKGKKQYSIAGGKRNIPSDGVQMGGMMMSRPTNSGENTLTSGSFQYSDSWGPKLRGTIIYGLQQNDKLLKSERYSEQTFSQQQTMRTSTDNFRSDNTNHLLITDFNYNPDSQTRITISPSLSINNSTSTNQRSEILRLFSNGMEGNPQIQNSGSFKNGDDYRLSGGLMISRKIDTVGRNILFSANMGSNASHDEESQDNELSFFSPDSQSRRDSLQSQNIDSENDAVRASFMLTYTEPIGKKSKLDLILNHSLNQNHNDRSVYDALNDLFIDSLSTFARYKFVESSMQLNYRHQQTKFNYTIGLSGINSLMKGRLNRHGGENRRSSFNFAPNITVQWMLPNNSQLRINYITRTSEPSFEQINPVPDRSNPQHIIIGNPNLRAQLFHLSGISYMAMYPKQQIVLNGSLGFRYYQDRTVANTLISTDPNGILIQETGYRNISGDYGLIANYFAVIPLVKNKYVFDFTGNYSWNRNSFFSDRIRRSSGTLNLSQSITLHVTPVDGIKFSPRVSYTHEKNKYDGALTPNEPVSNLSLSTQTQIRFFKELSVGGTFDQNFNKGYRGGVNESPTIINLFVQNQFFKDRSGTLKLSVSDLLDQNISLNRSISANSIMDRRENTIGRYLILTYSQRIGKF